MIAWGGGEGAEYKPCCHALPYCPSPSSLNGADHISPRRSGPPLVGGSSSFMFSGGGNGSSAQQLGGLSIGGSPAPSLAGKPLRSRTLPIRAAGARLLCTTVAKRRFVCPLSPLVFSSVSPHRLGGFTSPIRQVRSARVSKDGAYQRLTKCTAIWGTGDYALNSGKTRGSRAGILWGLQA